MIIDAVNFDLQANLRADSVVINKGRRDLVTGFDQSVLLGGTVHATGHFDIETDFIGRAERVQVEMVELRQGERGVQPATDVAH